MTWVARIVPKALVNYASRCGQRKYLTSSCEKPTPPLVRGSVNPPLTHVVAKSASAPAYFFIVISTRRFFWRPSGSSDPLGFLFGAIGFDAPNPSVRILPAAIPCPASQALTDAARRSDN